MVEFINGIVSGIVSFFTVGIVTIAGVISPSPTPTPMSVTISTSTAEVIAQNATITNLPTITRALAPTTLLTANGRFSYRSKNADIELSIPESGGKFTGSVKELCNGAIEGNYQKDNNTITGTANGTCIPKSVGLSHPDYDDNSYFKSTGEFSGEISLAEKIIKVKFKGRVYPPYFNNGGYISVGERNITLNIQ